MSEANIEGSTGGASPARQEPHHLRRAVIIWVVLSIIGIALWLVVAPFVYPPALVASTLSGADDFTFLVLMVLSVPVAMFVFVFLGYSLFAFRVKDRPTEDGVPLQPRPSLQIAWLGITGALCLFLIIWGFVAFFQETAAAASNTLVVRVTGQQWLWSFDYPQYGLSSQSQVIDLPVNRPVQFVVTSEDVLHGFSIRALGVRVDANPGEITTTPIMTPTQMGSYSVYCVELCGLYHSYMWQAVNVVDNASFNSWILSQGGHL
jgi:cytochrome c oxidase subunit II